MENEILLLEKSLFNIEYMSNREWLDNIVHNNFIKCGKSGMLFDKKVTVDFLLSCDDNRNITIYNFECKNIDKNTWLAHYVTKSDDKLYYRTSIWIMDNNFKLLYHQATELNTPIVLKEF